MASTDIQDLDSALYGILHMTACKYVYIYIHSDL